MAASSSASPQAQTAETAALIIADPSVRRRQRAALAGQTSLFISLIIALMALVVLLLDVVNKVGGMVVYGFKIDPLTVVPAVPLEELSQEELLQIAKDNIPAERLDDIPNDYGMTLEEMTFDDLIGVIYNEVPNVETLTARPLETLANQELIEVLDNNITDSRFNQLNEEKPFESRSREELIELIESEVLLESVVKAWPLFPSLFNRSAIEEEIQAKYPGAEYEFHWWLTPQFIISDLTTRPETTGIRTAIIGSVLVIFFTILIAVPIGVAAGIYLEEFATRSRINSIIQTNIYNLAGVPSIIYGMLGVAIFVRALSDFTSGRAFGVPDPPPNGRTVISAAMTMALLILPLIIINTQEAIRAVPQSLRDGSLALGATKWQTVWHHVLPVAIPSILTGVILGISRAIGETAPLIVVGAAAFITTDPSGLFSSFTVLPMQIYSWAILPTDTFRNISAAAIVVLLVIVLLFNLTAIIMRNRLRKSL
ncbi:MAG: phosphate ABC transporter permease PstA [Thermoflexales bacterium]|nr:phosphate ABC transporter permease PstA [Thermoflexales bacterium]MDW8351344.1 phosphate ABC transporter permease PstA [Anaerolineae bacterium]